jgi:hypothetical protein
VTLRHRAGGTRHKSTVRHKAKAKKKRVTPLRHRKKALKQHTKKHTAKKATKKAPSRQLRTAAASHPLHR